MSAAELERSVLDGKDRDELHAIAIAIGVRASTRMRKAELVDAILEAAGGQLAEGAGAAQPATRRAVRSARASEAAAGSVEALAAEEAALAAAGDESDAEAQIAPRPRRTPATSSPASPPGAISTGNAGGAAADDSGHGADDDQPDNDQAGDGQADEHQAGGDSLDADDEGGSYADGNSRRRRRRRGRGPGEGGEYRSERELTGEPVEVEGLVELRDEGYGFLRTSGYLAGRRDVYVSASQVRRFGLRKGDYVTGASRPQASNEKYPAMLRVDEINGQTPDEARSRVRFEDLTPLFPDARLRLEQPDDTNDVTGRIVDLLSPIGKGQRGLIVSPPKAGKTTILKHIVASIERNNPEVHLMVLLVDERPEEVTDMRRHVQRGEVVASTFDRPSEEHTQVAELTIERAKRLVELGNDVVIILDGITRLARAYNLAAPTSGRVLSGGVDSTALYPPKRFFGAARNIEEGGSLTIIATALVETGSRMDEVIFEEFKGTGNMELRLDRKLAERRLYPAIDVEGSSTRHEELLFDRNQLNQVWKLRRVLHALDQDSSGGKGLELLLDKLRTTSNDQFLSEIAHAPNLGS